jgi:hypothetical protein
MFRPGGAALARVLAGIPRDQLSGTLLVTGDPGGAFHLQRGAIVEVASPGAPGVETLLLRSGRVSEADWASVVRSGAPESRIGAELVARELVGTAELQLICVMAALDGAFAVGMGRVDGFSLDQASTSYRLGAPQGIEPEWLVQETARRIRALGSFGVPLSPFHDRLAWTDSGTEALGGSATGERREILRRADGRRSSRDIAFLLGRSLYAVTVEASRLVSEGLLAVVARPEGGSGRSSARPDGLAAEVDGAAHRSARAARLPHRQPGASRINEVLPLRPAVGTWGPPPTLLAKFRASGGLR